MKQALVTILGRGSFTGTILRETTLGYYIWWPATTNQLGSSPEGEWFAKASTMSRVTLV